MLTHFSLFTGIGGIDLAAEWAGYETVGQCEWADYPTKVLEKHWPDVPRWRDIRSVTKQSAEERGIDGITLISGGFPCQPFSVAGKQRGKQDDRYLWPEMLRVISELGPYWILGENVPGIINLALDNVLIDLENIGYTCQAFNIPACAVDALHRRSRIFIIANSNKSRGNIIKKIGRSNGDIYRLNWETKKKNIEWNGINGTWKNGSNGHVANSNDERFSPRGFQGRLRETEWEARSSFERGSLLGREWNPAKWDPEPELGRVANGIPHRVDRLKCLGNAVVPQQVYPILKAIADIERGVIND